MKYIIILFTSVLIVSCKETKVAIVVPTKPQISFDWLSGNWQRSNDEPGQLTYEQWSKSNDSLYLGLGFTMKGKDTVWQENIKLMKQDTNWVFSAISKGESKSTDFVLTDMTNKSFICENEANEFPKKIAYELQRDSIKAIISGGGPAVSFLFGRHK